MLTTAAEFEPPLRTIRRDIWRHWCDSFSGHVVRCREVLWAFPAIITSEREFCIRSRRRWYRFRITGQKCATATVEWPTSIYVAASANFSQHHTHTLGTPLERSSPRCGLLNAARGRFKMMNHLASHTFGMPSLLRSIVWSRGCKNLKYALKITICLETCLCKRELFCLYELRKKKIVAINFQCSIYLNIFLGNHEGRAGR